MQDSNANSAAQASTEGGSSFSQALGAKLTSAKTFVLGRQEPEPQGWLRIFNCLSNDKSYTYAIISFVVAVLFGFLSFMMLTMIVLSPDKFVLMFTITVIAVLTGFAFLKGPRTYVKNLFTDKNLYASITLLISMLLALYCSLIMHSYIWSLVFCLVEGNSLMYFFCNSGVSLAQVKMFCTYGFSALRAGVGK